MIKTKQGALVPTSGNCGQKAMSVAKSVESVKAKMIRELKAPVETPSTIKKGKTLYVPKSAKGGGKYYVRYTDAQRRKFRAIEKRLDSVVKDLVELGGNCQIFELHAEPTKPKTSGRRRRR